MYDMRTSLDNMITDDLNLHDDTFRKEDQIVEQLAQEQFLGDKTSLTTMTGLRTKCDYYRLRKSSGRGNFNSKDRFDSETDVDEVQFNLIEEMILLDFTISSTYESNVDGQADKSLKQDGTAKLPPRTFIPTTNDMFVAKIDDHHNLYRIINVDYETFEDDGYHVISFDLREKDFNYETDLGVRMKAGLNDTFVFVLRNLGNDMRAVLLKTEYLLIEQMRSLYFEYEKVFNNFYYSETLGTYRIKQEDYELSYPDEVISSGDIYDQSLVRFMKQHGIFLKYNSIQDVTEYGGVSSRIYIQTIFDAITTRNRRNLRYIYYYKQFNSDPQLQRSLLGKNSLIPMPALNDDCIDIYPQNLGFKIITNETISFNIDNVSDNIVEFFATMITEYVSNKDTDMRPWVNKLFTLEPYTGYLNNPVEAFYLLPLVTYILMDTQRTIMSSDYIGQELDF